MLLHFSKHYSFLLRFVKLKMTFPQIMNFPPVLRICQSMKKVVVC